MAPQEYLRSNTIYVRLFLIRRNLSGGVRLLGNLPSHVGGVKVGHGAMPSEVRGALRSRLEA